MSDERLERLRVIAEALRDVALADAARAADEMRQSQERLRALVHPLPEAPVISPLALAAAQLRHDRWTTARRTEINQLLALQTAHAIETRASAARALGRAEVLRKLTESAARRRY